MIKEDEKRTWQIIESWRIRRLFRAVLALAVKDAYAYCQKTIRQKKRRREAVYFLTHTQDLKTVCDLADAPWHSILQIARSPKLSNRNKYKKIILLTFKK